MGSPKEHPVSHIAYGYATQVVILDESGKVTEVVAAHDVGTVINVQSCEGQVEGGVVMGLGYAFTEDFPMVDGRPVLSYGKLGLFRATAAPDIKPFLSPPRRCSQRHTGRRGWERSPLFPRLLHVPMPITDWMGWSGENCPWRIHFTGKKRRKGEVI